MVFRRDIMCSLEKPLYLNRHLLYSPQPAPHKHPLLKLPRIETELPGKCEKVPVYFYQFCIEDEPPVGKGKDGLYAA